MFNPAVLFYIASSFGFSLMVVAWIFYRISGGLFNPVVSFRSPFKYNLTIRLGDTFHGDAESS